MSLLFELLQVSLGTRDKLSCVPNAREWDEMYEEAERQAVVSLLLCGLERLPDEQLPPVEVKLQWIGMGQMNDATYKRHCECAGVLTRWFRAVGVKSCVIKGISVAQYYPVPSMRQCGDIDLWVNGHRKDLMLYLRSEYDIGEIKWHHIDAKVFDDVPVEVHVHPGWVYNPINNRRLQKWFGEQQEGQMVVNEKLGFACTTAVFASVFSLVHTFHHFFEEGIGLRHIVDYYYITQALPSESHQEVMRVLKRIGLDKFAAAVMWVLKNVCGMSVKRLLCEPNEKEGKLLLSEIIAGGNFGQTRQDGKTRNTFGRWSMMAKHYPHETWWVIPWKVWHKGWMAFHN